MQGGGRMWILNQGWPKAKKKMISLILMMEVVADMPKGTLEGSDSDKHYFARFLLCYLMHARFEHIYMGNHLV